MNSEFIISNDNDLRDGLKKWYCEFINEPTEFVYMELRLIEERNLQRVSANGFNNLLTLICALKEKNSKIKILIQLLTNDLIKQIDEDILCDEVKHAVKRMLIFFDALNLVDMLLKLDVIVRPSKQSLQNIIYKLGAKKEERKNIYSSKILCLSPLINNSEEQFNLTYRMKTLINILYWQLKGRIEVREIEEASGQIMFELVKNIYQHSGIKNNQSINGFTCAQISTLPIIQFKDNNKEKKYTEASFLALTQSEKYKMFLDKRNFGSFISITVNDFGVGIHEKVKEKLKKENISNLEAIIQAFTTTFSSKPLEYEEEYWQVGVGEPGIRLEHKGYGLIYCLMFVYKNLGRIKICSGDIELQLFTRIDSWAQEFVCDTPVDFMKLISQNGKSYLDFFEIEVKKFDEGKYVGTQILIEIPANNVYRGRQQL